MSDSLFGPLSDREAALVVHTQRTIARKLWDRFCYECDVDYVPLRLVQTGSVDDISATPQQVADGSPIECFTFDGTVFFLDPKVLTSDERRSTAIEQLRVSRERDIPAMVECIAGLLDPVNADNSGIYWVGRGSNQESFRIKTTGLPNGGDMLKAVYAESSIRASLVEMCDWLCNLLESWTKESYVS